MSSPVFVVGTMRSGSTLLRLVLDSHPSIAISEETGFMGAVSATKTIPNWRYGAEWYARLGWTEAEVDDRLQQFYSGMFARYAASQGKKRWGDKTPFHSRHMDAMATLFPDAVFVGIVRHPAAVASSLKKRFHYTVADAATYWANTNTEILRNGMALGDRRFVLCRYEDVVLQPETTLRELTSWLQEPWSADVLRHNDVQAAKGAPRIVDGSTSTREPISTEKVERGASGLDGDERASIRATTGPLAEFLGYDVDDPLRLDGLGDREGSWPTLLTGDAIEVRRSQRSPRLSFTPPVQDVVSPELGPEELAEQLRQARATITQLRARPVVRFSDAVRQMQRRAGLPRAEILRAQVRRRLARYRPGT